MGRTVKQVFDVISGSHLYGFDSPDSDTDIRGVYIAPTEEFLGLCRPNEHYNPAPTPTNPHIDLFLYEIGKFMSLMHKGNCNILEQLFAEPLNVYRKDYYEILRVAGKDCICARGLFNSYRGMAIFNYKKYIQSDRKVTAKKYLYVFRGLLSGIHVLTTGKIEPNINKTVRVVKPDWADVIDQLVHLKRESEEVWLKNISKEKLDYLFNCLMRDIVTAYNERAIPETPSKEVWRNMNDLLIKIRMENLPDIKKYNETVWYNYRA